MAETTVIKYVTEALMSSEYQLNRLDKQFDPKNGGKIGCDVVLFAQTVRDCFDDSSQQFPLASNKTALLLGIIAKANHNICDKGKTMILNYFQIILDEIVLADLSTPNNTICTEDCPHKSFPICRFFFTLEKSIKKLQNCYEMNQHSFNPGGNSSKGCVPEDAFLESDCYNLNIKYGFVDSLSVLLEEFTSRRSSCDELELFESMVTKLEKLTESHNQEPNNPTLQIFATIMRAFLEGVKFGYIKNVINSGELLIELD